VSGPVRVRERRPPAVPGRPDRLAAWDAPARGREYRRGPALRRWRGRLAKQRLDGSMAWLDGLSLERASASGWSGAV